MRTPIRNRTRALFKACATTLWVMAASWICGRARRAYLNMDLALEPISATYAATTSRFLVAVKVPV